MNQSAMIRECLAARGPSTQQKIVDATGLTASQVKDAIAGLSRRGALTVVGHETVEHCPCPLSIYALADEKKADATTIVRSAIASQPELMRVWA